MCEVCDFAHNEISKDRFHCKTLDCCLRQQVYKPAPDGSDNFARFEGVHKVGEGNHP